MTLRPRQSHQPGAYLPGGPTFPAHCDRCELLLHQQLLLHHAVVRNAFEMLWVPAQSATGRRAALAPEWLHTA